MCGFCNVWLCVCVGIFLICVLVFYRVFVLLFLYRFIVFMLSFDLANYVYL